MIDCELEGICLNEKIDNITKRQHYVPRMFLKRWENHPNNAKSNGIYVYDLKEKRGFQSKIENIAVINNYYEEPKLPVNFMEKQLQQFESVADPIIPRLIANDKNMDEKDQFILSQFFILQEFRTPKFRRFLVDPKNLPKICHILQWRTEYLFHFDKPDFIPEWDEANIKEWQQILQTKLPSENNFLILLLKSLSIKLSQLEWTIWSITNQEYHYITSDAPIIKGILNTDSYFIASDPELYFDKSLFMIIPLSANNCLVLYPKNWDQRIIDKKIKIMLSPQIINGIMMKNADRYLFCQVKKDLSTMEEWKMDSNKNPIRIPIILENFAID